MAWRWAEASVRPISVGALSLSAPPGPICVCRGRGPQVDHDALTEAPRAGHLRRAMSDIFAMKPHLRDWPVLRRPDATLPFVAGASLKTVRIAARKAAESRRRAGEPPLNPC